MGKFKEIDLFCEKGDKEGLIAFLAEHGIQNPHKQANIYLEEYKMANKTVKISDINREIAFEMKMDKHISSLLNITNMLDTRIDLLKERIVTLENKLLKLREVNNGL